MDMDDSPISTDELSIQVAHTRSNRPYLSVADDEGHEVAAVDVVVDEKTGVIAIRFDQYTDCSARFEVVENGIIPNKLIWRS
ncbi:hypothetical protein D2E70_25430 [Mycobacteroides abscessus]|uniref:hypothetical protein n=1 Tax=Mycobacteroides abscessus TaxID=36809 RepID=UPI000E68B729|nr:hypothetical protein [Mycobacteroides abscessus]RIS64217.1 hypothetical protein D2E70_25430 [Mycobacteroides abscessus]